MDSDQSSSYLKGIFYLLFGMFCLVTMDLFAKFLAHDKVSPIQILAIRSSIAVPCLILIHSLSTKEYLSHTKTSQKVSTTLFNIYANPILIIRGFFGFLAPFCFFSALQFLSLSDATLVFFSSTFIMVIMSIFILKESVGIHRWSALIIGFIGVFIAIDPEGENQLWGYFLTLFGASISAMIIVSGRILTRQHAVSLVVTGFNIGMGISSFCLLYWAWKPISLVSTLFIAAMAVCSISGHLLVTTAYSKSPAAILAPFEYSALVWAILLSFIIWQDIPTIQEWIGGIIIVSSGLYIIYRERINHKQQRLFLKQ